jgi:hypothetical protein
MRWRHGDVVFATRFSEIDRNQSREPHGAIRKIAEAALTHDVEPSLQVLISRRAQSARRIN